MFLLACWIAWFYCFWFVLKKKNWDSDLLISELLFLAFSCLCSITDRKIIIQVSLFLNTCTWPTLFPDLTSVEYTAHIITTTTYFSQFSIIPFLQTTCHPRIQALRLWDTTWGMLLAQNGIITDEVGSTSCTWKCIRTISVTLVTSLI